jgi:hypothetical protein
MRGPAFAALLILAGIAVAGCAPHYRYHERGYRDPYGHRTEREMNDDDAWEIVRRDPCRYDEYRRFAAKHKNPERRRDVVWRLAREGCSRERAYDYDSDR